MANVARSIGATGRDYSSIAAWESDLSDTSIYASGDDAEGNCYADSDFSENVSITGTFDLSSITITAAPSDRHDGTIGSGALVKPSGASYIMDIYESNVTVSWLEINGNDSGTYGLKFNTGLSGGFVQNCLIHNFGSTSGASTDVYVMRNRSSVNFTNNFIFNNTSGSSADLFIHHSDTSFGSFSYNNTYYYNNVGDNSSNDGYIFYGTLEHEGSVAKNIVILRYDNNYWNAKHASATLDYWGAVGAITGVSNVTTDTYANSFIDTSTSDPDLHLKTGCNFIGAAADVGTSPTNVEIDINANDRDSAGVTWDLGAHEFELPIASTGKKIKPNTRFHLFHGVEGFGAFSTEFNF
ncbi:MAG: hypothetical protein CMI54_07455 [Parcubacteria group bacterium]|nr:hypothetical protein [Parcubacteria group bacterium]